MGLAISLMASDSLSWFAGSPGCRFRPPRGVLYLEGCAIVTRMNGYVPTNGIRIYGTVDDFRYAQEIGVMDGTFVAVPVFFDENGYPDFQPPMAMGELVIHAAPLWVSN